MNPSLAGKQYLSIVIPCLNEEDTIGRCIRKADAVCRSHGIPHEIIVADNGSSDASARIATELGARVVNVVDRGYGAALRAGILASRGRLIIMGDADDSYDFRDLRELYWKLLDGYELVLGCRLPAGGGMIASGAMPWLHRHLGNPCFTWMVRFLFGAPVGDVYCGLRGFTRELFDRLRLEATGMEFAVEMVVRATQAEARIANVPLTLYPDGRCAHRGHLRTFRDGWRTLTHILRWYQAARPSSVRTEVVVENLAVLEYRPEVPVHGG